MAGRDLLKNIRVISVNHMHVILFRPGVRADIPVTPVSGVKTAALVSMRLPYRDERDPPCRVHTPARRAVRLAVTTSLCGARWPSPRPLSAVGRPRPGLPLAAAGRHGQGGRRRARPARSPRSTPTTPRPAPASPRSRPARRRRPRPTTAPGYELAQKQDGRPRPPRERAASAQRQADAASPRCAATPQPSTSRAAASVTSRRSSAARAPRSCSTGPPRSRPSGAARNRTLQRASATSVVADTMRRQAAQAEAQQLAAAQRAEQARSAAQAQADAAVAASGPDPEASSRR